VKLRERQKIALDFIQREVESGAGFPSKQRIAEAMGYQDNSVVSLLESLSANGFIRRTRIPYQNKLGFRYVYELAQ
jgi:predicted transcriptional regulator